MSGIDQFLAQNYTEEDTHKVAAAELFCKMASENGINLNALSDDQINHLWNETGFGKLAEEGAKDDTEEKVEAAAREHEEKKEEAKKEAEAINFGKIAAESFVMHRLAFEESLEKEAADGPVRRAATAVKDFVRKGAYGEGIRDSYDKLQASRKFMKENPQHLQDMRGANAKELAKNVGRAAAVYGTGAAAVGGGAYVGGKKLFGKKEEGTEKGASALDSLAAELAVEKVASFGLDTNEAIERINAVLVLGPSDSDKVAFVSDLSDAVDVRSSELLELAGYPIDWSNTPFAKEAEDAGGRARKVYDAAKRHAGSAADFVRKGVHGEGIGEAADQVARGFGRRGGMAAGETKAPHLKHWGKELAKRTGRSAAVYGTGAGAAGAAGYGGYKALKSDEEKKASIDFDIAAGNVAVKMASDMGWNPDYVAFKINELFSAGAEGDPAQSGKVASAQDEDGMLVSRAGELLELCGFEVSWG